MNSRLARFSLPEHLRDKIGSARKLCVAFSGGLDSTVLLAALAELRENLPDLQLRALHIHHGLSQLADSWVAHCQTALRPVSHRVFSHLRAGECTGWRY